MKVLSVNPGIVFRKSGNPDSWSFSVRMKDGRSTFELYFYDYPTAKAAEQAMREKVRFERIRHGLAPKRT